MQNTNTPKENREGFSISVGFPVSRDPSPIIDEAFVSIRDLSRGFKGQIQIFASYGQDKEELPISEGLSIRAAKQILWSNVNKISRTIGDGGRFEIHARGVSP